MSRPTLIRLIVIIALFGGMPLYWWAFPPRLPIDTANGTYANPCCGSLTLTNGQMVVGQGQFVSYVVEHDKIGRYVLPASYVGVTDGRVLHVDRSANPLMLRLDDTKQPASIDLWSTSVTITFSLT